MPKECWWGFWKHLGPNQTVFQAQTETAGGLPGHVANTTSGYGNYTPQCLFGLIIKQWRSLCPEVSFLRPTRYQVARILCLGNTIYLELIRVRDGSGPSLWVWVLVETTPLPHSWSRSSRHPNRQFRWCWRTSPNRSEFAGLLAGCPASRSVDSYNALVFAVG